MEANRVNINRERSPRIIFSNRNHSFTGLLKVSEKCQLDVQLEIVKQSLQMDEQGNEVMRYTLKVVKAGILNEIKK